MKEQDQPQALRAGAQHQVLREAWGYEQKFTPDLFRFLLKNLKVFNVLTGYAKTCCLLGYSDIRTTLLRCLS